MSLLIFSEIHIHINFIQKGRYFWDERTNSQPSPKGNFYRGSKGVSEILQLIYKIQETPQKYMEIDAKLLYEFLAQ